VSSGLIALAVVALGMWKSWPNVCFWWRFEKLGLNAQGYPEYRHRRTGIVLVRVRGGRFFMGAQGKNPQEPNYDPEAAEYEGPVHEVELSPFLVGKYEVTQAQWLSVMRDNPSEKRWTGDNLPVVNVSWDDCQEFCRKAGLKLPTEAQWEYACRAGTSTAWGGGDLADMGWCPENSGLSIHPVGQKLTNGFGIHDMHGNVSEWCEDMYDQNFYGNTRGMKDPICSSGIGERVFRGGSWIALAKLCHSGSRDCYKPSGVSWSIGFRISYYPVP